MIGGMKHAISKFTKIVLANKFLRIGFVITAALLVFAVLGQFWTPYPLSSNFGISQGPTLAHPLGTDEYGEEVLSVMMASTWPTLEVGLLTGALVALLSTLIGMIAGYYASKVVGSVVDVLTILMLTVPGIILVVDIYGYESRFHNAQPFRLLRSDGFRLSNNGVGFRCCTDQVPGP
jgi:ABC-type dipeptide/oligopeptide/nickel transport systems, permease components